MIPALTSFWLGLPQWARDAIKITGIILAVIFLGRQYVRGKQREAVTEAKAKWDAEAQRVESEVISNIQDNTDAVIHEADAVREHTTARILPNGGAALDPVNYRD